jgi:small subunit ribosomal protein S1
MTENKENEHEVLEEGFLRNAETGKIEPDYEGTIKDFSDGDIVTGTVVRVDRDEVLVDIGYKSEGVIPARELSIRYGVSPEEVVKIGETIDALVLQKEDKDGRLILSKKRAEYERVWQRLDAIKEIDGTVKGQVIEVVKGGLIVDIGLRGFVPASLVDTTRVKDLKTYIGQEFECKIVELNRSRNNVVLSRRAFLDTLRKEEKKILLDNLEKGQTVKGTVSSIVSFGAFVDIGGMDGLVHISELSWGHVDHPSEVLAVGDEVTVQILDVDKERNRISLGLKQCQPDPWKETVKRFKPGEIVEGTVMKLVPFGAFVSVADGVEGLIHISELAESRVEFPGDVVEVGQTVTVKVVDVELDRHRLSLSLKQAMSPEEKAAAAEAIKEAEAGREAEAKTEEAAEEAEAVVEETAVEEPVTEEAPPSAEAMEGKPEETVEADETLAVEAEPVAEEAPPSAEAPADEPEESATEKALRDIESVDRDIEAIDAAELTSPDLMKGAKETEEATEAEETVEAEAATEEPAAEPAPEEPAAEVPAEAATEEATPADVEPESKADEGPTPEPGSLEAILADMKKESKGSED